MGTIGGGLDIVDTNLNATGPSYATQSINMSGIGFSGDATLTTVSALPSPVTVGQPVTLTAAVSDTTTPATVPTGGVSFIDSLGGTMVSLNNGTAVPLSGGIAALPVTLTGVGAHTITANYTGVSGSIAASTGSVSLTVAAIVPTLSFAAIAAQTYGNPPFAVSATSASSGAVTYAVVSGPATIAGTMVTLTGVGAVVLSASQAASGNYAAATVNASFTVAGEVPTLSFGAIAAKTYGNLPFAVSATSASSGVVTYTVVSGPATIVANIVTLTGVGTVVLSAGQAATANDAAATATTSFTVAAAVPTLSFGPIAAQTYGNPPFAVSATSASSGPVTYAVVSGPATIAGNMVTLTGAGTVMLSASQAAGGNYAAATATAGFLVAGLAPTLSFAPITAQTYGNAPFAVSATSASSGAVTYTVVSGPATIAGNIVTLTGPGTVMLSANQAASGNYAVATANISFTVALAVPTLSFEPIAAQTYGNAPFAVSATSASSGAVTYTLVSGPATIAGNMVTLTGPGTVVLSASQAATGNYAAATATTSFTVAAAAVVFTLNPSPGSGAESVLPGGAVAFTLTLAPGSGSTYPDAVTFSATGLPAGATATFSPAMIPAGSGATAVTMTIHHQPADGPRCETGRIAGHDGLGLAAAADGRNQAGTQAAAEYAGPAGGVGRSRVVVGRHGVLERLRQRQRFLQPGRHPLHRGGNCHRYGYRCTQLDQRNPQPAVDISRRKQWIDLQQSS